MRVQQEDKPAFSHGRPNIVRGLTCGKDRFLRRTAKNGLACAGFGVLFGPMRKWRAFLIIASLGVLAAGAWWIRGWSEKASPLPPQGGLWFPTTVLNDVPHFAQNDPCWSEDKLASTPGTLGQEGCAVASAAMVLASYGADLDPGRLNAHLRDNGGFTERGWLYWEKACAYPPAVAEHVYEDDPSHFLIDWNLLCGNPVIVRLRYPSGTTHFVVIVGKSGFEYLIRDPGDGYRKGVYFLSEFGSSIEALRFYEKLAATNG
jgi:hypothetical protein